MTTDKREVVYLGRDNTVDLQILADGIPVDLSSITKYELKDTQCSWLVSSLTSPTAFDDSLGDGKLTISLGEEVIPVGDQSAWLILYDANHQDGIIWCKVLLTVINICVTPNG